MEEEEEEEGLEEEKDIEVCPDKNGIAPLGNTTVHYLARLCPTVSCCLCLPLCVWCLGSRWGVERMELSSCLSLSVLPIMRNVLSHFIARNVLSPFIVRNVLSIISSHAESH